MRLLIVTQTVSTESNVLGFFVEWIRNFAKNTDSVMVLCLESGTHDLDTSVRIQSLGKEYGATRVQYIGRLYKYIWKERNNYDAVFVHMNPIYILLCGPIWKALGKRIGLWYTHGHVGAQLRIAARLADVIFTASPESCAIKSHKLCVTGHGIDRGMFPYLSPAVPPRPLRLLSVGRIAPIKNLHIALAVLSELVHTHHLPCSLTIVGSPISKKDENYFNALKALSRTLNIESFVLFAGNIRHKDMNQYYCSAHALLHLSDTGSIDKVVLEAISTGLDVLTSSAAFHKYLPNKFLLSNKDPKTIANIIAHRSLFRISQLESDAILKDHQLQNTIERIVTVLAGSTSYVRN